MVGFTSVYAAAAAAVGLFYFLCQSLFAKRHRDDFVCECDVFFAALLCFHTYVRIYICKCVCCYALILYFAIHA